MPKHIKYFELVDYLLGNEKILSNDNLKYETGAIITHYLQSDRNQESPYTDECVREKIDDSIYCFGKNRKTVYKDAPLPLLSSSFNSIPFPPPKNPKFTFIDLFAGIGGFRIALQNLIGKCVFSCDWDKYAQKTYFTNFGEYPFGDIKQFTDPDKVSDETLKLMIPDHDLLVAGFPCQPFSIAGVSKKNSLGRKHGFDDPTQGTLFFDIKRILKLKRPKAFILENVKNLLSHDRTRTFQVIMESLEGELGYVVNHEIVDGAKWVPQHRERVYIVGYNPEKIEISKREILIPKEPGKRYLYPDLSKIIQSNVDEKYTLGPGTWATLERHRQHHLNSGNGFGYGLIKWPIKKDTVTRTISARYHKDGAEILIEQKGGKRPRRLTVQEAKKLQGFPDKFSFSAVSETQAYRQIGNSVVVPAVESTAKFVVTELMKRRKDDG